MTLGHARIIVWPRSTIGIIDVHLSGAGRRLESPASFYLAGVDDWKFQFSLFERKQMIGTIDFLFSGRVRQKLRFQQIVQPLAFGDPVEAIHSRLYGREGRCEV